MSSNAPARARTPEDSSNKTNFKHRNFDAGERKGEGETGWEIKKVKKKERRRGARKRARNENQDRRKVRKQTIRQEGDIEQKKGRRHKRRPGVKSRKEEGMGTRQKARKVGGGRGREPVVWAFFIRPLRYCKAVYVHVYLQ